MRDLRLSLAQHETATLRAIAEGWGVNPAGLSSRLTAERLADIILSADWSAEYRDLPAAEQGALAELAAAGGYALAGTFFRRHGSIRAFGPSRLAREQPWNKPQGASEGLWYRGVLFSAFQQTELGSQQVVYVPDDLRALLPVPGDKQPRLELVPVQDTRAVVRRPAAVGLVDDCCTLLAYVQRSTISAHAQTALPTEELLPFLRCKERARLELIWTLLLEAGLLEIQSDFLCMVRDPAHKWLTASLSEQTTTLVQAWSRSRDWNDLRHIPELVCEPTGWENDPVLPRQLVLRLLVDLAPESWWLLKSLPAAVKVAQPDFQRTGGEYDAWYISDSKTGEYLIGYHHWDRVEGALLNFLVTGPLHWLGLVELGEMTQGGDPAFRPTPAGRTYARTGAWPQSPVPVRVSIQVNADATIAVPAAVDRFTRFFVARMTDWEPLAGAGATFRYRVTPRSLERLRESDTEPDQAMAFLASRNGRPLPRSFRDAVSAWARTGAQVQLGRLTVLQVRDDATMAKLQASPKVQPLLGEALGPRSAVVRTADWRRLVGAIAELGLLTDLQL